MASGNTPICTFNEVVKMANLQNVSFKGVTFIGLDEWVGIPPENEGSCSFFLHRYLFNPLNIAASQIRLFDSLANDLSRECENMNEFISAKGGIDLILVGVGMNGHVGFNEPGTSENLWAHVVNLDSSTITVGQKYFNQETFLSKGITMGLKNFLEARKALLMASGKNKADIVKSMLERGISIEAPASFIRKHENGIVLLDDDASSLLA
jgi:glucosamine-6-phosphate isomerase